MENVPDRPPPTQPDARSSWLAVAPSRPTCPRGTFPDLASALSWGRRMAMFYPACFSVFRVDGPSLTLEQLLPPPRTWEDKR
jgi:hypothetical protein